MSCKFGILFAKKKDVQRHPRSQVCAKGGFDHEERRQNKGSGLHDGIRPGDDRQGLLWSEDG